MGELQDLAPVSDRYADLPVADAFNWQDATAGLGAGEWYLVAFRAVRRPDADEVRLTRFDELAHQEAAGAPGFLHYFKGPLAAGGSCLSFCLWESRPHARAAAGMPDHVRAVSLIDEMYVSYTLEFLRLTRPAEGAALSFEPYDGAPAHAAPIAPPATGLPDGPAPIFSVQPSAAS
jgi:hypothetical protein